MGFNESYTLSAGMLSEYVTLAQENLPSSNRLLLFGFINTPLIIILLHAIWQVVNSTSKFTVKFSDPRLLQIRPKSPTEPPVVFHWLPIIGSAVQYGNDPINFFLRCREKVRTSKFHVFPID